MLKKKFLIKGIIQKKKNKTLKIIVFIKKKHPKYNKILNKKKNIWSIIH